MKRMIFFLSFLSFLSFFPVSNKAGAEDNVITWEECVEEAKKSHPDLVSAREKVNQSKASKEITRSTVMPQVSGDGSGTRSKAASLSASGSSGQGASGSTGRKPTTTYQYEITGQQLLFDGFKTSYDLSGAERGIISSRYNYDVTSSNVRLRLRTAFIGLLNAQELLRVTEEIEARRKQNLELVKLRYEGGREHRGSMLTSAADFAEAGYEVAQAKRNIHLSQRRLTKELGRATFVPMETKGDLEIKKLSQERPDFEKLTETNPFLRQLVAQKEAAKFGYLSANAQFFPQIYASGSSGNTNTEWPPDKNEWSVGLSISVPIFDGGSKFATLSKARATWDQAQADERSGKDGVILTLYDTWTKLQDAGENVEVQRQFLEAAKERSRIAEAEYSNGLLLFDNWIIIEDDYVTAKKNFLNAQTNALLAEANWVQAEGGTLDYD